MSGQKTKSNGNQGTNGKESPKTRPRAKSGGNGSHDVTGIAPIPPDGDWGWVVTFSSFMVGLVVDGICFTFGFFFLEFQTYFGSNKSVTSLINSTLNGTYLTIGKRLVVIVLSSYASSWCCRNQLQYQQHCRHYPCWYEIINVYFIGYHHCLYRGMWKGSSICYLELVLRTTAYIPRGVRVL